MITERTIVIINYSLLQHPLLQKLRESLALFLLTFLPLHALLVTVGTKLITGPGHAPLTLLALWKEGLLALILLIACIEILFLVSRFSFLVWPFAGVSNKRTTNNEQRTTSFDLPDILILSLIILSFLVPLETGNWKLETTWLHGFRYDFVPLLSFLILRRVPWSDRFKTLLPILLLGIGALIATYGIISFFLPAGFFTWLGYSDLHSLYVPDGPVAAFQQIGSLSLRRIQSTLSGPNQLGLWLLIPWSILMGCLLSFVSHSSSRFTPRLSVRSSEQGRGAKADGSRSPSLFMFAVLSVLLGIALLLTFSRAAWISAFAITIATLLYTVPRKSFAKVFIPLSLLVLAGAVLLTIAFPTTILRIASSRDHFLRPMEAVRTMIDHPLGLGLGTAGPASNRTSDPCVFLEAGSDPSWAVDRPALCVFVGDHQVQPTDRICRCPFLPENWYLQIGVELGMIGFLLFLLLTIAILHRTYGDVQLALRHNSDAHHWSLVIGHWSFLSFLAISLAALFLHAWEDSATAWTVWMLISMTLPIRMQRNPSAN